MKNGVETRCLTKRFVNVMDPQAHIQDEFRFRQEQQDRRGKNHSAFSAWRINAVKANHPDAQKVPKADIVQWQLRQTLRRRN